MRADRGCVDKYLRIGMLASCLVVGNASVIRVPADKYHLCRRQLLCHKRGGTCHRAGSCNQDFSSGHLDTEFFENCPKSVNIGVITLQNPVFIKNGVDGAHCGSGGIDLVQKRKHRIFVRVSDIDSGKIALFKKIRQLFRRQNAKLIRGQAQCMHQIGVKDIGPLPCYVTVLHRRKIPPNTESIRCCVEARKSRSDRRDTHRIVCLCDYYSIRMPLRQYILRGIRKNT